MERLEARAIRAHGKPGAFLRVAADARSAVQRSTCQQQSAERLRSVGVGVDRVARRSERIYIRQAKPIRAYFEDRPAHVISSGRGGAIQSIAGQNHAAPWTLSVLKAAEIAEIGKSAPVGIDAKDSSTRISAARSEERRVGKECRSR